VIIRAQWTEFKGRSKRMGRNVLVRRQRNAHIQSSSIFAAI
jgi:hypothetical protein